MKYWLGVVSKEHVQRGVQGGFAQVCHGKKAPLGRLSKGDGFIYYSPKVSMHGSESCKSFTAIGKVKNGKVYQVEMTPDFHPFRLDIDYFASRSVPLSEIFDYLELTRSKNWGMLLRRGLLEISSSDFEIIAKAMKVDFS